MPEQPVLPGLTPAWRPATLDPRQAAFLCSPARFNYVHSGRRSWKTQGAKYRLVRAAICGQRYHDARYFACAPTHQQAKEIFWSDIKALVPRWALATPKVPERSIGDGELRVHLWNGAQIKVAGLDKPQRIEGGFWDGGVITEYGDVKKETFTDHVLPMMIRGGWIDVEGVPEGRNHFWDEVQTARRLIAGGGDVAAEYAVHHWPTWDVLHLYLGKDEADRQLRVMRESMDELTWRQEVGGEFVEYAGAAYHCFDYSRHVHKARYNPALPLVLCFDFNVSPGTCVYAQEQPCSLPGFAKTATVVLGEAYIPRSSNTPAVCRKVIDDWMGTDGGAPKIARHELELLIHGDPAGGQRNTKYEHGSDWTIIEDMLGEAFGRERVKLRVARSAPRVRARVNAVNSRLRSADGTAHMVFDPGARRTIEDVQMMRLKDGSAGELDDQDGKYGHLTAALGYYLYELQCSRAFENIEGEVQFGY